MSPRALLLGGLAFALTFNLVWALSVLTWSAPGLLSVVAAAACTLIVPAGLHLWPLVPVRGWITRTVRALVMTGVCVAAAVTSFDHTTSLLVQAGWTGWTAAAVAAGVELLVALSTMALRPVHAAGADTGTDTGTDTVRRADVVTRSADQPAVPGAVPDSPDAAGPGPVPPVPAAAVPAADPRPADPSPTPAPRRTLVGVPAPDDVDRLADLRAWVKETGEIPTETAVRRRFRCRQTVAQRLLDQLAEGAA